MVENSYRGEYMKITALGTGSALSKRFFNNNYIFEFEGKRLLIDGGTSLKYSLQAASMKHSDIDYAIITHFHFDHAGGIEELLTHNYWNFENGQHVPKLTKFIMLESQLPHYESLLHSGLKNQGMTYVDYMQPIILTHENSIQIDSCQFTFIDTSNMHCAGMQSYALHITDMNTGTNIIFSSDIQDLINSGLKERINEQTAAIFQDVSFVPNPVHASFDEICAYYPKEYHSKVHLMHYGDDIEKFIPIASKYGMHVVKERVTVAFS